MYLAIARKWRPCRFEDLVGQTHVVQTLKNAISFSRVSHAYLFSGARGVGKTSVARIFAMALRCPQSQEGTPCNTCTECMSIRESRSVDVVEIDGASHNGVEAVRSIRENVVYAPATGTYKIYIIDEVHMLSVSAFNALLKTLEEPPPHVLFIFATTEMQKIPLTILSRCQRFEFRRLTQKQITERLAYILQEEKIGFFSENGIRVLAAYGDGSLRDSLSLLDQVLSYYSGEKIDSLTEAQVVAALGVSASSTILSFLEAVTKKENGIFLKILEDTYNAGIDLKGFAERCLEELRHLYLLVLTQKVSAEDLDLAPLHFQKLQDLSNGLSLLQIERMSQILGKAASQLAWASLPRFILEIAAVHMSRLDTLEKVEAALLRGEGVAPKTAEPKLSAPVSVSSPTPTAAAPKPKPETKSWNSFVDLVMKKRPLLGALLSHGEFSLKDQVAYLTFPEGSFYERQSREARNKTEMEELIKSYFGPSLRLELSSKLGEVKSLESDKQAEVNELKKEALSHPAVLQAQEVLGAELIDVNVELS